MNEVVFRRIREPYGWFSNMSPHAIIDDSGTRWNTSEALFQATRFSDRAVQHEIQQASSPMAAKMIAKRRLHEPAIVVRQPRSPEDVDAMYALLQRKVQQHPDLQQILLQEDLAQAVIIEDCSARQNVSGLFWGAARVAEGWHGENTLGKLWMRLRDHLRAGMSAERQLTLPVCDQGKGP